MYRFVRAGVRAACLQTALVAIVALVALAQGRIQQGAPSPETLTTTALAGDHSAAVALVDVLFAACVSMLRTQAVTESAHHLAAGVRRLGPRNPDRAAKALISQLLLTSMGCAAIALRPPPDWFQSLVALCAGAGSGLLVWPGMMSVGAAAFGATTHAAILGHPG